MGSLLISSDVPSFEGGVAHIWLEARAPADAPSERLAETRIDGIAHRRGHIRTIPFGIACPELPRGHAHLRAWVDLEGRGAAALGDLFSTEAIPVEASPLIVRVEDPAASAKGGRR